MEWWCQRTEADHAEEDVKRAKRKKMEKILKILKLLIFYIISVWTIFIFFFFRSKHVDHDHDDDDDDDVSFSRLFIPLWGTLLSTTTGGMIGGKGKERRVVNRERMKKSMIPYLSLRSMNFFPADSAPQVIHPELNLKERRRKREWEEREEGPAEEQREWWTD